MQTGMPTEQKDVQTPGFLQSEQRPMLLYAFACLLGVLATGVLPLVGVFLVAYSGAVLSCRKYLKFAYAAALLGSVLSFFWDPVSGASSLLIGFVTVTLAGFVPRKFGQTKFFLGSIAIAVSLFCVDMLIAYAAGTTLQGQISAMVDSMVQQFTAAGTVPAEALTVFKQLVDTIMVLWPSIYAIEGLIFASAAVLTARFAARRHSTEAEISAFAEIDFSVHIVWPLIAGLLCIAAAYLVSGSVSKMVSAVGYNLIVCSVALYAIQGFTVITALMEKANLNWIVRLVVYVLAIQMELMFFAPSIIGLLDLWVNFRKLPTRQGS